MGPAKFSSDPM
jgi:hypothetical protein